MPGPQAPLYLLGHELRASFPVAFLAQGHALAVAIMSYNGGVHFGLLADDDALPDLDDFSAHLDESLAELLTAARAARPTLPPGPADANGLRPPAEAARSAAAQ